MGAEMAPRTTRTLNPLPFQDLEPHRFEDLVRQLAYEFREWVSLEAIGRSGADEGIDIRGVERVAAAPSLVTADDADGEDEPSPVAAEQVWIFQCKREKSMSPSDVTKAVAASLDGKDVPHGFVLAAACDLSKKARDTFRAEMVKRGVAEFHVWARGELEDMLFQAANDRLLFAYFAISLQPRKRSLATTLRSEIALKKQLKRLLESEEGSNGIGVLLRDPTEDRYPYAPKSSKEPRARWLARKALHLRKPGHLAVLDGMHPAWIAPDGKGWDFMGDCNRARSAVHLPPGAWARDEDDDPGRPGEDHRRLLDFFHEYVPERDQAWVHVTRYVPLARIVAVDPIGDGYFPVPHILVEFDDDRGPYGDDLSARFESSGERGGISLRPRDVKRVKLFPKKIPEALYPPLPQFEQTAEVKPVALSSGAHGRAQALWDGLSEKRANRASPQPQPAARERSSKLQRFREWRTNIALPVLKRLEVDLRSAGNDARIVAHGISEEARHRDPSEMVELRVRLNTGGSAHNSEYRPDGFVRWEAKTYGSEVEMSMRPSADSSGRPRVEKPLSLTELTTEAIEDHVLGMLERLAAGKI
jgi:hypothetical protein